MKSSSAHELTCLKLALALATASCASAGQGDTTGSPAGGVAPGSGGLGVSAAGAAGSQGPTESGGSGGSGGAVSPSAGSSSESPAGAAGIAGTAGTAGSKATGGAGGASSTPDDPPCTDSNVKPGTASVSIAYANANRDYKIHVPASYTGKERVPLVIDMHGSGQSADAQMGTSGWNGKSDKTGFIVVYPTALNARWNAGTCCSPSVEQNVDDVGFLRAVVEKVKKDACIDRKRIYASGLSGGGLMSYRLACEAADIFAAVAPVSGATVFAPCQPSAPISVVAFRGLNDDLVPYNGGMPLKWYFQGAKADFDQWSMLDKCQGPVDESHAICQTNTQCAGSSDVTLCSVNGGHVLYGDAAKVGAAVPDVAWEIFARHSRP